MPLYGYYGNPCKELCNAIFVAWEGALFNRPHLPAQRPKRPKGLRSDKWTLIVIF